MMQLALSSWQSVAEFHYTNLHHICQTLLVLGFFCRLTAILALFISFALLIGEWKRGKSGPADAYFYHCISFEQQVLMHIIVAIDLAKKCQIPFRNRSCVTICHLSGNQSYRWLSCNTWLSGADVARLSLRGLLKAVSKRIRQRASEWAGRAEAEANAFF